MADAVTQERTVFLSTSPAADRDRRLALAAVLVSTAIFAIVAPFAKVQLTPVFGFIPVYQSALAVNDLITAVLLFGQYRILRSRGLAILASGYLFTAFIAVAHMLTFPGLFGPTGLLGAGPQSTAWLYMFWHGVFPLLVIAYAMQDDDRVEGAGTRARPGVVICAGIGSAFFAVCAFTLLATAGSDILPAIMQGNRYTPAMVLVVSSVWLLSVAGLAVLWRRKPLSMLDLWLMVVMCAWIYDIALAAVLNAGRFDLGFYAGRVYGLAAATFVLAVLLLENGRLYVRLAEAHRRGLNERRLLQERTDELTAVNKELDMFSFSVAHDLRAPVRAVDGFARMLEEDYGDRLDGEGRRLLSVVRESCQRMRQLIDDLLEYARLGRQPLRTRQVELETLVYQTMAELRSGREAGRIEFAVGRLGSVEADPALLKQALANLLGNAIKFTRDKNPAIVEVGCRTDAGVEEPSVYYVKDNGAGFDMRQYDRLFGVFQRLHRNEEYEGTGVGLAIVQRVITRHGGRVWAESAPGQGATFYFTLTAGQVEPMARAAAA